MSVGKTISRERRRDAIEERAFHKPFQSKYPILSRNGEAFVSKRMHDFAKGKMYAGPHREYEVKSVKQALAIAHSEAKSKGMVRHK